MTIEQLEMAFEEIKELEERLRRYEFACRHINRIKAVVDPKTGHDIEFIRERVTSLCNEMILRINTGAQV
jgi:hypothetical protein